jgi:4-hydroxy-2-oxoheptanedioate aldolase
MRPNRVKQMWREGKPVACAWLSTADTYIAETLANAGLDAIVVDMQHGMAIGPDRAALALQAISTTSTVPLVRVPWNEPAYIQWVLDAGAYGVIVPLVNTRADAEKAAGACRYAPLGYRSNGANRARYYVGQDYFEHANEEIICLVMTETVQALDNLDAIGTTPGVDGFYIGPTDLAITMGLPPQLDHPDPRHAEAVQKVVDAARRLGIQAGIHTTGAEEVVRRYRQGFTFATLGNDVGYVAEGVRQALTTFRSSVEQPA